VEGRWNSLEQEGLLFSFKQQQNKKDKSEKERRDSKILNFQICVSKIENKYHILRLAVGDIDENKGIHST